MLLASRLRVSAATAIVGCSSRLCNGEEKLENLNNVDVLPAALTPILNTVHYRLSQVTRQQDFVPKQVIDPEKLVAQAYAIASRDGISALSVRKVAAACGIAVGSVYGYFPTKADLTAAVLARFFEENLSGELCAVRPGERFTSYVRRFREALCAARADMSVDWFAEMRRLPSSEQNALVAVRAPMLAHIERGLARVLDGDEAVDRSRLVGPMEAEALCRYVLRAVFASLMEGDECETLFALLDAALYDDNVDEKDMVK